MDGQRTFRSQPHPHRALWQRQAWLRLSWLHLYQPEGAILAVGCGTGEFLNAALSQGCEIYGLEASESEFRHAQRLNAEVVMGGLRQAMDRYGDFRFNAITFWDSLGDVEDPIGELALARQLLSESGQIFLEVPHVVLDESRGWVAAGIEACLDQRRFLFSVAGLDNVLAAAGLKLDARLVFSRRIYLEPGHWRQLKNQALLAGHAWPPLAWVRVVASPAS